MSDPDKKLETLKLAYERATIRYEDIHKAVWQNFSYLAVVAGAILTLGEKAIGVTPAALLACVPLLVWFWAVFLPLNYYGDNVERVVKKVEADLSAHSQAEVVLYRHFRDGREREEPNISVAPAFDTWWKEFEGWFRKRLADTPAGASGLGEPRNWEELINRTFNEPPAELRKTWIDGIHRGVEERIKRSWKPLTALFVGLTAVVVVAWRPQVLTASPIRSFGAVLAILALAVLLLRRATRTLGVRDGVHVFGIALHIAFFFLLAVFVQGPTPPSVAKPISLDLAPLQTRAGELASRVEELRAQVTTVGGGLGSATTSAGNAKRILNDVENQLKALAVELKSPADQNGKSVKP